ncbi:MAG: GSU2403 family nucleotidyltransferase fold protein [Rhodospirillaceae bacterium]
MPQAVAPFSDEQMRIIANLNQHYDVWIEAERDLAALPYGMRWAERSGKHYLYHSIDRAGNAKSLGPRSAETERVFAEYHNSKSVLTDRKNKSALRLAETCRLYRALGLPLLPSEAAKVLREADRRRMLGPQIMVVGTNAMPAYAMEAAGRIGAPDETDDFDMAWTAVSDDGGAIPIWSMLKAADSTYTVNTERTFQARNATAYEVEILVAPSRAGGMRPTDRPLPIPLPEQEWLLEGKTVSWVVVARDGSPARIVAPDPRWFALHKLWMSDQEKRNPLKRPKDRKQGFALLNAVWEAMPQFPLDADFRNALPEELLEYYDLWRSGVVESPTLPNW